MNILLALSFILGGFLGYLAVCWIHFVALIIFWIWMENCQEIEQLIPLSAGIMYYIGAFFGNVVYFISNPEAFKEVLHVVKELINLFPIWR